MKRLPKLPAIEKGLPVTQLSLFDNAAVLTSLPCLTIRQPWAHLIITPAVELGDTPVKGIENRSRQMHYRGPMLIHAGGKVDSGHETLSPNFVLSAIVGVVTVVDCVPISKIGRTSYGTLPYAIGPYCIILRDPRRFATPVPWKGQQGIFRVPISSLPELLVDTRTEPHIDQ